jgi:hypothetical protein
VGEVDSQLTADSTQSILSAVLLSLSMRTLLFPAGMFATARIPEATGRPALSKEHQQKKAQPQQQKCQQQQDLCEKAIKKQEIKPKIGCECGSEWP